MADEIEERGEEEEAAVYRRLYTVRQRQDPMELYTENKSTQKGLPTLSHTQKSRVNTGILCFSVFLYL